MQSSGDKAMKQAKKHKAPGKSDREGISLLQLAEMFPTEEAATKWLEETRWPDDRPCPHCGDCDTYRMKSGKPMPFRCRGCWKFFSVRTKTVMERSHIPLKKWVWAIYLSMTSLKGVSSMKLHRDLGISQRSAWFMAHRLREAMRPGRQSFAGPVEIDEVYIGGKRRNMSNKRRKQFSGRGPSGKTAVVGIKDRPSNKVAARVVGSASRATALPLVSRHVQFGAVHYTDDSPIYDVLPNHESVKHTLHEYVRGDVHTNGIESFWSMLKRAHAGTFHKLSVKHLHRYVHEFATRHNLRERDTLDLMGEVVARMAGRRLLYKDLAADNGLPSGARPSTN